ncbi:hypothetical protein NL108_017848 [Boleophthalmus pectinirostris]|uniref:uncharacterized protein LOC129412640 n=1 Tax=Boleophthalmus pectinirostris TaxID=150288 RepID=UPI00242E97BD|nr:uncharacterized protein LOC129412640 [Boleophthalmus pectinirostris]XP_055022744.1 uncharacterized protein LOC129412640 [Boleophthalmus pectinirostris]KAJ0064054.1 hypothetical protein NL108_017848 [Boleophthalmus pectinirostris]
MNRADYVFPSDEDFIRVDPALIGNRSKPRFTHGEVKVLLEAIKKNRYVLLRKFNQGVSAEAKKKMWCRITDQINSLGENQREVRQIMKKWADLKFDAKRRMLGSRKRFRRRNLGPIEKAVHKILTMSPKGDGESDVDLDEDRSFASISLPENSLSENTTFSLPDSSYSETFSSELSLADRTGDDLNYESPDYSLDFDEEDDEDQSSLMESEEFFRSKPTYTYSRQEGSPLYPQGLAPSTQGQNLQHQGAGQILQSPTPSPLAQCLQQQRVGRMLLASVARSVETLARSLQLMKQRQQDFVQESLQLQRQSVDTLRDFSSTALAMLCTSPRHTPPAAHTHK